MSLGNDTHYMKIKKNIYSVNNLKFDPSIPFQGLELILQTSQHEISVYIKKKRLLSVVDKCIQYNKFSVN